MSKITTQSFRLVNTHKKYIQRIFFVDTAHARSLNVPVRVKFDQMVLLIYVH